MPPARRLQLARLLRDLETVRLDGNDPLSELVPELRTLVGVDLLGAYSVREHEHGWQLDRFEIHGHQTSSLKAGLEHQFERASGRAVFYDLACPAPHERNRLVEAIAQIDATVPGTFRRSALYREALAPIGLGDHLHHRMLLCDGASLLAWFGALHPAALTRAQQRMLRAIARPLHQRLRTERLLEGAPRGLALLDAALAHIGRPAFVVDRRGALVAANAAARAQLASRWREVRAALRDALAGRPSTPAFDVTAIHDRGLPPQWLAVARSSPDVQIAVAVARTRVRWQLTARQAEVLALVVRGLANATIAAELKTTSRAVEMHVTALLDRAGADSRAALVGTVLLQ